ncbi:MAG: SHOCT domain-containing protein [Bacteroidota bacterium]
MRNITPSSIIFFVVLAIILSNLFPGGFLPVIIAFFIFRSLASGNDNQVNPRGSNKNRRYDRRTNRRGDRRYRERESSRDYRRRAPAESSRRRPERSEEPPPARKPVAKKNPFKKSGIEKFKDYDYEGAIEDFQKALQVDGEDKAVHFNIACAYSLMEDKEKSFYHLSEAVKYGLVDFEKIKTHDALAYIRIQDEFEAFSKGGYRWPLNDSTENNKDQLLTTQPDILEQLKQLGELRDRGLLTQEEFLAQKEKLMR